MQNRFLKWISAFAAAAVFPALLCAQAPASAKTASPDISGVWTAQNSPQARYRLWSFMAEEPPMTPWALERFKLAKPSFGPRSFKDSNDPVNPTTLSAVGCFPPGVPRIYLHPFPMEIIQLPNRVLIIYEFDHHIRQIWMDGRQHGKDQPDTWLGDSIGKWEGDTLVVDSTGFNDKSWVDRAGHPHSDQLHVVERLRRVDVKTLQIDITIDDPIAYTKPWGGQLVYTSRPDWNISEMVCVDNANFEQFLKNEENPAK